MKTYKIEYSPASKLRNKSYSSFYTAYYRARKDCELEGKEDISAIVIACSDGTSRRIGDIPPPDKKWGGRRIKSGRNLSSLNGERMVGIQVWIPKKLLAAIDVRCIETGYSRSEVITPVLEAAFTVPASVATATHDHEGTSAHTTAQGI